MLTQEPPETTLYSELIRRGLPADYARRTAEELDDHRADLLNDLRANNAADPNTIANERLGETRQLAKKIARNYRRRTWLGRWPLVNFVVLPPVVLVAMWGGVVLTLLGLGRLWTLSGGESGEIWSPVEHARLSWLLTLGLFAFVVPSCIAWFYGRVALRMTQSRAFVLSACLGIGLLNSIPSHTYRVDPANPELAVNLISVPSCDLTDPAGLFACVCLWATTPFMASQFFAPVLIGTLIVSLDTRRRRAALLAPAAEADRLRLAA